MIYLLGEEESVLYLENPRSWDAYTIEEHVVEDLRRQEVTEPVAVVLSDRSAVAFYVDNTLRVLEMAWARGGTQCFV